MDHRPIELEEVLDLAFRRAYGDFQDKRVATAIAIQVARQYMGTWRTVTDKWRITPGQPALKETIHSTNPAYYLDYLISLATKKRKEELLEAHLKGKQALSEADLWLFFIEELSRYAKMNKSPYMATATLMVLCDYANRSVLELYRYLNKERYLSKAEDPSEASASVFSRHKLDGFIPYMSSIYGRFVEVEEAEKGKKQFVKAAMTPEALAMLTTWLELLTPLYPDCFLPETFDPYEVEKKYISYNSGDYVGAAERRRKHVMQCPKSLSKFLAAAKYRDWTKTFAPPKMTPRRPDSGDKPPADRFSLRKFPQELLDFVKEAIHTDDIRRQGLSQRSLFLGVENGKPQMVRPGQKLLLQLKDGDGGIFVSGQDWKGFFSREILLLDTHLVFWGEEMADEQPVHYVTHLKDGRRLELTLTYEHDMRSASAEATYYLPERESVRKLIPTLAGVCVALLLGSLAYSYYPYVALRLRAQSQSDAAQVTRDLPQTSALSNVVESHPPKSYPAAMASPHPTPDPSVSGPGSKSRPFQTTSLNAAAAEWVAVPPAPAPSKRGASQGSEARGARETKAAMRPKVSQPRAKGDSTSPLNPVRNDTAVLYRCGGDHKKLGAEPPTRLDGLTTPTITGMVTAHGNNLHGVSVTAIDIATHKEKMTRTGRDGRFAFPNLTPGNYAVLAWEQGFKPARKGIFEVNKGVGLIISFDLKRQPDERRAGGAQKLQACPPVRHNSSYFTKNGRPLGERDDRGHMLRVSETSHAAPGAVPSRTPCAQVQD